MFKIESVEDQQKFIIPLTRDTEKIYYNLNMVVDGAIISNAIRNWRVTKVNRLAPNGLIMTTLYQEQFNPHTAGILYKGDNEVIKRPFLSEDKDKNVKAWYANYYSSTSVIEPEKADTSVNNDIEDIIDKKLDITYTGVSNQLKVGGSYKKFTANYYIDEIIQEPTEVIWSYSIISKFKNDILLDDASEFIQVLNSDNPKDLGVNQIKIKFTGDATNIGNVLRITCTYGNISNYIDCEIVSL